MKLKMTILSKMVIASVKQTPKPVTFSLTAGVISLASLTFMPSQPVSILVAYSLGIMSAVILVKK